MKGIPAATAAVKPTKPNIGTFNHSFDHTKSIILESFLTQKSLFIITINHHHITINHHHHITINHHPHHQSSSIIINHHQSSSSSPPSSFFHHSQQHHESSGLFQWDLLVLTGRQQWPRHRLRQGHLHLRDDAGGTGQQGQPKQRHGTGGWATAPREKPSKKLRKGWTSWRFWQLSNEMIVMWIWWNKHLRLLSSNNRCLTFRRSATRCCAVWMWMGRLNLRC